MYVDPDKLPLIPLTNRKPEWDPITTSRYNVGTGDILAETAVARYNGYIQRNTGHIIDTVW